MSNKGPPPLSGVALAGFMGVGKSTVGPKLGRLLGLPWWDLDERVEADAGRSIPELFQAEGESGFRKREHAALVRGIQEGRAVISLGGGALLDDRSRRVLASAGWVVVVLTAPWPALVDRIVRSDRPLRDEARQRFVDRRAHYAALGPQVDTSGKSPEAVAAEVAALVAERGRRS